MPREKAKLYGINSLSQRELLALIIKSAYKDRNVFELADDILIVANGFENLLSLSYEELVNIKGIKDAKAMEILAILEIYKRLSKVDMVKEEEKMNSPGKIVKWLRFNLSFSSQEEFLVIYISNKGKIINSEVMFKGNRNSSIVGIDAILRKAILLKATGLIVAHNHPSDNVEPSTADIEITDKLYHSCQMMGIPLIDHIIVGKYDYFSFKENGVLK